MEGTKQAYEFELNSDQMDFIRSAKEKYGIADESTVVRIMVVVQFESPKSETISSNYACR